MDRAAPGRYGIEATFVDVTDPDAVRSAIRPETRLVCVEAIANPTTKVADIALLAEIAHAAGAILMVDSTFTPRRSTVLSPTARISSCTR